MSKPESPAARRSMALLDVEKRAEGRGLLWGFAICVVVGSIATALSLPTRTARKEYGAVLSRNVGIGKRATPYANVSVGDRQVRVALPTGSPCQPGDRISLIHHKTAIGDRYQAAPMGCDRP